MEITFTEPHSLHINWNSLIPPMLNVWRDLRVTQSDDGTITVEVIEEN